MTFLRLTPSRASENAYLQKNVAPFIIDLHVEKAKLTRQPASKEL